MMPKKAAYLKGPKACVPAHRLTLVLRVARRPCHLPTGRTRSKLLADCSYSLEVRLAPTQSYTICLCLAGAGSMLVTEHCEDVDLDALHQLSGVCTLATLA